MSLGDWRSRVRISAPRSRTRWKQRVFVVADRESASPKRLRSDLGGGCTRARLSAEGRLFTCLFAVRGHDLRAIVRDGASDAALDEAIAAVWRVRFDRYSELRTAETAARPKVEMSYIGG